MTPLPEETYQEIIAVILSEAERLDPAVVRELLAKSKAKR